MNRQNYHVKKYKKPTIVETVKPKIDKPNDVKSILFTDQTWDRIMTYMDSEINRIRLLSKERLRAFEQMQKDIKLASEKKASQQRIQKMLNVVKNQNDYPQKKRAIRYVNPNFNSDEPDNPNQSDHNNDVIEFYLIIFVLILFFLSPLLFALLIV